MAQRDHRGAVTDLAFILSRNVTGSPGAVNAGNDTGTNRRRIGRITTGPILRMLDLAIHRYARHKMEKAPVSKRSRCA